MNLRKISLIVLLWLNCLVLSATHQRAGEITYRHISGLTYEFKITTYTYTPSPADRPEIEVLWGDGTSSVVNRTRRVQVPEYDDVTLNEYVTQHTFPTTGSYSITFEDPNRNAGVVNIPNSVNIPFFLETILNINPFLGQNNSPQLLNPPIDNGCTGVPYYHNPGAYDPDGDSLSYSLIECRGYGGNSIPGYTFPAASNSLTIDPVTGEVTWDSPMMVGEYNIAILIREWRHGVLIGSVVRDMQINIVACNNLPPEIYTIDDTCILAGDLLIFDVRAEDNTSSLVTLSATGTPFQVTSSPAVFPDNEGVPPVISRFEWATNCSHVQLNPYSVLFKANDHGPQVSLSKYKTVRITVIAPKPENLSAIPVGNTIRLTWSPSICSNATGYKIYRRNSSNPFEPEYCQTGMPPDKGYELIGTTTHWNDTSFTDDGSSIPLYHNNEYCYRVFAFFADGAESYVSDEVCISLVNDAPRITYVDVMETDTNIGIIRIEWQKPEELDTVRFPGPGYEYRIWRASSQSMRYELINRTYSLEDTSFIDIGLNTAELTYFYKIELWGETVDSLSWIETSDPASSVFISIVSSDRQLRLSWNERVPWHNLDYTIYRYNEITDTYDSIANTQNQYYLDKGLMNDQEYCYYVMASGAYFIPDTLFPLHNRSQKACAIPVDKTPPEIPEVTVTTDCESVEISWTFSSDSTYLDVYQYTIFYKPSYNEPFVAIDSFYTTQEPCYINECRYIIRNQGIITGCFAVMVADSNGNKAELSKITCFDYDECMDYSLPNVFTPNGDGYNDVFRPYPYTNVSKVNMVIYNRWGRIVFKTEDPDINWDGNDYLTKQPCADGPYYYACDIYLSTLSGIITLPIHGTVTLLR